MIMSLTSVVHKIRLIVMSFEPQSYLQCHSNTFSIYNVLCEFEWLGQILTGTGSDRV